MVTEIQPRGTGRILGGRSPLTAAVAACLVDGCPHRRLPGRNGLAGVLKPSRSIRQATVIPALIYLDVREAAAWLSAAFGFSERLRIGDNHRSQLQFGDGAVIIGDVRATGDRPGRRGHPLGHRAARRCGRPL
jgi:hypothetical protein